MRVANSIILCTQTEQAVGLAVGGWVTSSEVAEAEGQWPGTVQLLHWAPFLPLVYADRRFPEPTLLQPCAMVNEDGPLVLPVPHHHPSILPPRVADIWRTREEPVLLLLTAQAVALISKNNVRWRWRQCLGVGSGEILLE